MVRVYSRNGVEKRKDLRLLPCVGQLVPGIHRRGGASQRCTYTTRFREDTPSTEIHTLMHTTTAARGIAPMRFPTSSSTQQHFHRHLKHWQHWPVPTGVDEFILQIRTSSSRAGGGGGGGRVPLGELADGRRSHGVQQVRPKGLAGADPKALGQPFRSHHLIHGQIDSTISKHVRSAASITR